MWPTDIEDYIMYWTFVYLVQACIWRMGSSMQLNVGMVLRQAGFSTNVHLALCFFGCWSLWLLSTHLLTSYFALVRGAQLLWWACLFVCLSVCKDISRTTRVIFTKFFVHIAYGLGSVLLLRRSNTLCTSGFVDDVMFFSIMGHIMVWVSLWRIDFA